MGVRGLAAGLLVLALAGCGAANPVKPDLARLQVQTTSKRASVYIDGHYAGSARLLGAKPKLLVPGVHLVTIQADDYFPHDLELDLKPGTTTVKIELRPRPVVLSGAGPL